MCQYCQIVNNVRVFAANIRFSVKGPLHYKFRCGGRIVCVTSHVLYAVACLISVYFCSLDWRWSRRYLGFWDISSFGFHCRGFHHSQLLHNARVVDHWRHLTRQVNHTTNIIPAEACYKAEEKRLAGTPTSSN